MLQRMIDDLKHATESTARQAFFVGAAALSLLITTGFLCAAAFVVTLQNYGLVQACLVGAAVFFVVTLLSAGSYAALKRSSKRIVRDTHEANPERPSIDPMMLAMGLQLVRAVGVSRILPILAIGGVALGYFMRQQAPSQTDEDLPE